MLIGLAAAPAVVRIASLMPIRGIIMPIAPEVWITPVHVGHDYYKLVNRQVVEATDLMDWAKYFEGNDRRIGVADTKFQGAPGNVRVSTVFLGIDHNYRRFMGDPTADNRPVVFETMVFGGKFDQEQERYSTFEEAERGHKEMFAKVRRSELKIIKPDES